MSTPILGSNDFTDVPTVQSIPLLLNRGNTPSIAAGLLAAIPAAGTVGALYVTTDTNHIYRDNGTTWVPLSPGVVLSVASTNITPSSGTTLIPYDATTPLSTEGTLVWTQTFTPASATSKYIFDFSTYMSSGSNTRYVTAALFRGTTCIGASTQLATSANAPYMLVIREVDTPGVTTPITYSLRIGVSSNATWYIGQTTTGTFGGVGASTITVTETV